MPLVTPAKAHGGSAVRPQRTAGPERRSQYRWSPQTQPLSGDIAFGRRGLAAMIEANVPVDVQGPRRVRRRPPAGPGTGARPIFCGPSSISGGHSPQTRTSGARSSPNGLPNSPGGWYCNCSTALIRHRAMSADTRSRAACCSSRTTEQGDRGDIETGHSPPGRQAAEHAAKGGVAAGLEMGRGSIQKTECRQDALVRPVHAVPISAAASSTARWTCRWPWAAGELRLDPVLSPRFRRGRARSVVPAGTPCGACRV